MIYNPFTKYFVGFHNYQSRGKNEEKKYHLIVDTHGTTVNNELSGKDIKNNMKNENMQKYLSSIMTSKEFEEKNQEEIS